MLRLPEILENQLDLARGEAFLCGAVVGIMQCLPKFAIVLEFSTEEALSGTRTDRREIGDGEVEFEKVSCHGKMGIWLWLIFS